MTTATKMSKTERLDRALEILRVVETHGFKQYGVWMHTRITNNTMRYWRQGLFFPSARVLVRLEKFLKGVLDGKVKP